MKYASTRDYIRKAIKYKFDFCAVGDAGEMETFDSILNLKDFIPTVKFWRHTQKFL